MSTSNYLTEELLGVFLKRFNTNVIHNKNMKLDNFVFRPDYLLKDLNLVVEFNGYHHYTSPSQIIKDYKKREFLKLYNHTLVEIPYFIQLDAKIIKHLFGQFSLLDTKTFNYYPHGFIDKKAVLPASFCSLGIERFLNDIEYFTEVKLDIFKSLDNLTKILDPREIYFRQVSL